jgi:hypothetical protein
MAGRERPRAVRHTLVEAAEKQHAWAGPYSDALVQQYRRDQAEGFLFSERLQEFDSGTPIQEQVMSAMPLLTTDLH